MSVAMLQKVGRGLHVAAESWSLQLSAKEEMPHRLIPKRLNEKLLHPS